MEVIYDGIFGKYSKMKIKDEDTKVTNVCIYIFATYGQFVLVFLTGEQMFRIDLKKNNVLFLCNSVV